MTTYFVRDGGSEDGGADFVLDTTTNLVTGEADFSATFGPVTSLERDLLRLASATLAADRATQRGPLESNSRRIEMFIPVVNIGRLQPVVADLQLLLRTLSRDSWRIVLRQVDGLLTQDAVLATPIGSTLLFSGGLDSLSGAVELTPREPIHLFSHRTGNPRTDSAQRQLKAMLRNSGFAFGDTALRISSRSEPSAGFVHDAEGTQRSRSFTFIVAAALVARRTGYFAQIYVAENGQLATHLPLTQGRIGSNSTHTADPSALAAADSILERVFGARIPMVNPFLAETKAEVVARVASQLPASLPIAISCWSASHLPAGANHCGVCVPCLIRRVAIESSLPDSTRYARDIFTEDFSLLGEDDLGRRNLSDFAEFIAMTGTLSNQEYYDEWPELHNDPGVADAVIAMYRRFSAEAHAILGSYPGMAPLVQ